MLDQLPNNHDKGVVLRNAAPKATITISIDAIVAVSVVATATITLISAVINVRAEQAVKVLHRLLRLGIPHLTEAWHLI